MIGPAVIPSAVVPHVVVAGQSSGAQVERPAGRTTWAPGGWSATACPGTTADGMTAPTPNHNGAAGARLAPASQSQSAPAGHLF